MLHRLGCQLLAQQTYEELTANARRLELLGWALGILGFAILIGGVIVSEWLRHKRRKSGSDRT